MRHVKGLVLSTALSVVVLGGTASASPGSYTIQPIRCTQPVVYRVNVDALGAHKAQALDLVRMAADATQESMGQRMVFGGLTHEVPRLATWDHGGPLVVAFVSPLATDFYGPGPGGGYTRWDGSHAMVAVNPFAFYQMPAVAESGPSVLALVTHEFAHAVGVHVHSSNPADLMFPTFGASTPWTFNDGDRAMLAGLPCVEGEN